MRWRRATAITYLVTVDASTDAQFLPLQVTLVWTDPPGRSGPPPSNWSNNLDLVVTNFDDPANPIVFYGNDIAREQLQHPGERPPMRRTWIPSTMLKSVCFTGRSARILLRHRYCRAVNVGTPSPPRPTNAAGNFAPNVVQDTRWSFPAAKASDQRLYGGRTTESFPIPPAPSKSPT